MSLNVHSSIHRINHRLLIFSLTLKIYGIPRAAMSRELWSAIYKYNPKVQNRYIGKSHGFGFIIFIDDDDAFKNDEG
jgi:hypothetical protein